MIYKVLFVQSLKKLLYTSFSLLVLLLTTLLVFDSEVHAACAPGWTCSGTTVMDVATGCKYFYDAYGNLSYCTQDWTRFPNISCNSSCSVTQTGTGCDSNCNYSFWSNTSNCCIQSSSGGGGGGGSSSPSPSPSCTVSLAPVSGSSAIGNSLTFTATVNASNGTVDSVDFVSSDNGVATVNPASDTTAVYSTDATGVSVGTATITSEVVMNGSVTCSANSTFNVTNAGPWWQVIDSDVMTNGDLTSLVPDPSFYFDVIGPGGYPGVPVYGGSLSLGTGTVSTTGWKVNTTSNDPKTYNYAFFAKQIPSDVTITNITNASETGDYFASGGTLSRGYYWYKFDGSAVPGGSLTISSAVNIPSDRKVILLVDGADLNIQGNVTIASKGNGFFMAVVGNSSGTGGNVNIDPAVTRIEGLYEADSTFSTGAGSSQFTVYGSVAAGGMNLERDLGAGGNSTTASEVFNYAPELLMLYPNKLSLTRYKWEEVAP